MKWVKIKVNVYEIPKKNIKYFLNSQYIHNRDILKIKNMIYHNEKLFNYIYKNNFTDIDESYNK